MTSEILIVLYKTKPMKKQLHFLIMACLFLLTGRIFAQVPVANFSFSPNPVCAGSTVSFTDQSTNAPVIWSYTLAGATPSVMTVQNPTVLYNTAGVYTVGLTAFNLSGSSLPVIKTITVNANPVATMMPNFLSLCSGSSATFSVIAVGPSPFTYSWNTGATTFSINASPTVTTIYSCVITGSNGCTTTQSAVATVIPPPNVLINSNPTAICIPTQPATLTALAIGTGPLSYSWSTGSTTSVAITPVPGNFSVTVTDGNGCKSTQTINVGSGTMPSVAVTASPAVICGGSSTNLYASGSATSYSWNTSQTTQSISVSPFFTTTYVVTGTSGACSQTAAVTVTVNTTPTVVAVGIPTSICAGQSSTLTATAIGPVSTYSWSSGASGPTTVVSPTTSTNYTVTGTGPGGCSSSTIVAVTVNVCTNIESNTKNTSISLYPNPTNGEFNLNVNSSQLNNVIEIYNSLGELIKKQEVKELNSKINLSELASGIYHIRLMSGEKQVYKNKIIKE